MACAYSFRFSPQFTALLSEFGASSAGLALRDFRAAWERFAQENSDLVGAEADGLARLGFQGDVLRKMFLSARHYHGRPEKKRGQAPRRVDATWERYDSDLYKAMRAHVESHLKERPKRAYELFIGKGGYDDTERLKRAYKNMYYRAKRKAPDPSLKTD